MDKSNISQGIPPEVLALIQSKLIECRDAAAPYSVTLTPEERRKEYKASDGSEAFLEKAISYARLFPKLVPQQLSVKDLETMYGVMTGLMPVVQLAMDFLAGLIDTKMTASAETMQGALSFITAQSRQPKRTCWALIRLIPI